MNTAWAGTTDYGRKIKIKLSSFNPYMIRMVRTLSGRRWDKPSKCWIIPNCEANLMKLRMMKSFQFGNRLARLLHDTYSHIVSDSEKYTLTIVRPIENIKGLKGGKLRPFQAYGVGFIESRNGRALIADDMGLGKTVQALAWMQLRKAQRPAIIVCPSSLKINWKREAKKWMSQEVLCVVEGMCKGKGVSLPPATVYVVNYDVLASWAGTLLKLKPKILIGDEIHYIKNASSGRTMAFRKLAKECEHVIGLSGTPIINRPIEFFVPVNAIDETLFPSFWTYAQKFCGAKFNGYKWDFNGNMNLDELHDILKRSIMLRRMKSEVLKELPPKVRSVIPLEISNRTEYSKAEEHFAEWLKDSGLPAESKNQMEKLKQIAVAGKMKQVAEWISDFTSSGEKLIVFCTHVSAVHQLYEAFKPISVLVDGSVTGDNRQKAVDAFQRNPKVQLFFGNIKAAGVGLTLTAASNVCFVELGWSPLDHDQAEDRAHRMGQRGSVNVWYLVADRTVETDILKMLDAKRSVVTQILDGKNISSNDILSDMLKMYRRKYNEGYKNN